MATTQKTTPSLDRKPAAPARTPEAAALLADVRNHARREFARPLEQLDPSERWRALALAVRDRMMDRLVDTADRYTAANAKRVAYLSMEFLVGRSLANNLHNMGLFDAAKEVFAEVGVDLADVLEEEPDAALGNGGLGRLAACFLDSLATLHMPGYGYGINYEYGLFRQELYDGAQRERPESWLAFGTPWQIHRPSECVPVPIYGRIEHGKDRTGGYNPMWLAWRLIIGVPHDMPIVGYGGKTVNYLRLFSARAANELNMEFFNSGDYVKAVEAETLSETVTKVLYPSDAIPQGRELRLVQEYFLVACATRDIVRRYRRHHDTFDKFADSVAMQLNDTHPALAVTELMRYLIDETELGWEAAWDIVTKVFGYTNHTLMPEALEKWPVPLLERVLPRHLQIIFEINRRFLDHVGTVFPNDPGKQQRMSLIEEAEPKLVRMAHLAIVGSHSVNGVAELHSRLVTTHLVPDFAQLWPEKFNNKTNGVTPRRWLLSANPGLAALLTKTVGPGWVTDLEDVRKIEPLAADAAFREEFRRVKRANKERLAAVIKDKLRLVVDPDAIFDIQVKRIHEYKRQTLNLLHVIHLYLSIVEDGVVPPAPRVVMFAGKAAPGYWAAKQIIRMVHSVAREVNRDPRVKDKLKVVFLPDYRVTLAEAIIPAADLSEQISTAGTEASGTSCMKFAFNGALTIGTMDGANIEICREVGEENMFVFGLRAEEIDNLKRRGAYRPFEYYQHHPLIRRVLDTIRDDRFSATQPGAYRWLFDSLAGEDRYFHLADLEDYAATQNRAATAYRDADGWATKAILNVARTPTFSSDRTIRQYAEDIWGVKPVPPADGHG
ncbi:MAG TPA: glycogen/starch/alpha-glucan phosphorylase [Gemmataceae bacterium]|nr:glycogen/starch/alpha-glucan phosphorylase [Gemmataceae bacterium]